MGWENVRLRLMMLLSVDYLGFGHVMDFESEIPQEAISIFIGCKRKIKHPLRSFEISVWGFHVLWRVMLSFT